MVRVIRNGGGENGVSVNRSGVYSVAEVLRRGSPEQKERLTACLGRPLAECGGVKADVWVCRGEVMAVSVVS
jgi:hypothetical protein